MSTEYTPDRDPMSMLPRVKTEAAARIVGVGYEGFRSYLKRGILGRTGLLPSFHVPGADTFDDPKPRAAWSRFDFSSLCLIRTAKILMDSGYSYEKANSVVSNYRHWSKLAHDHVPTLRYLMVWPPYGDNILFEGDEIKFISDRLLEIGNAQGPVSIINLEQIQEHVRLGMLAEADLHVDA